MTVAVSSADLPLTIVNKQFRPLVLRDLPGCCNSV